MSFSDRGREPGVRETATDILVKVDCRGAYADILLDRTLRGAGLDSRDRALLTELVYGTLRWRGRLDAELGPRMRRPPEKTDPFIRNLLRLSMYQLRFLDKVPPYAVINEAVDLAKSRGHGRSSAFVNAVLRGASRDGNKLSDPGQKFASAVAIADHWSHPAWLVEKWLQMFGPEETIALLRANNEPAPLVLRANRLKGTTQDLIDLFRREGIEALKAPWSPQAVVLQSRSPVSLLPGLDTGRFQVQSEASQLVSYLLGPQPGERILDACAAPGGKTTHIAELMGDDGEVTATDKSEAGLKKITANVARLGMRAVKTLAADFDKPLPAALQKTFDRILVDAPCGGLGTLRSHPEIKWQRGQKDVERLARLQTRILARAATRLKRGGVLVYSTCTLTREENEDVVKKFLTGNQNFVLDDAATYLPVQARSMTQGRFFVALPHRHNTDGFFAARMRKVK